MDFIFERNEHAAGGKMQHIFIPYVNEDDESKAVGEGAALPYLNQ